MTKSRDLANLADDNLGNLTVDASGNLDVSGTVTSAGINTTGNITFGDNDKAIFGAGSDLQIYHNGNNSFIEDAGTGNLIIKVQDLTLQAVNGENYLTAVQNGAVSLFYGDNAVKLATTATGVDVTGDITQGATGSNAGRFLIDNTTDTIQRLKVSRGGSTGQLAFHTGTDTEAMRIDSSGNVGIGTDSPLGKFMVKDGTSSPSALVVRQTSEAGAAALSLDSIFNNASNTDKEVASIKLGVITNGSASPNADIRFETVSSGTLAEAMRITSGGNVGIGVSSPASPVHISSSADTVVTVQTTNATADGRINFRNSAGTDAGRIWYNTSGNRMMFYTDSTERMRIDNSGTVTATAINASQSSQTAIGATCMGWLNNTTTNPGTSRAGTSISFSNTIGGYRPSTFGVGTWRCHGAVESGSLNQEVSVWQRIS